VKVIGIAAIGIRRVIITFYISGLLLLFSIVSRWKHTYM